MAYSQFLIYFTEQKALKLHIYINVIINLLDVGVIDIKRLKMEFLKDIQLYQYIFARQLTENNFLLNLKVKWQKNVNEPRQWSLT